MSTELRMGIHILCYFSLTTFLLHDYSFPTIVLLMLFFFFTLTLILSPLCGIKNSKYYKNHGNIQCINNVLSLSQFLQWPAQHVIAQNLVHLPHAGLVLNGKPTQNTTAVLHTERNLRGE
jgi:hypothetical protein